MVGGGGISGFTERALFHDGALITGRVGTLGQLHVIAGPCWPSDNALVIEARDGVDPNFLRYALLHRISDAVGMNRGAANPLITQRDLSQLPVPDFAPQVQRAIGGAPRLLDDKIELNRRTNETLEAMAQAIFHDWFVDFGPTRRKLAGATVHFVTEELDAGPVVCQVAVPVRDDDTVDTLSARILVEEHRLYPEAIARVLSGKFRLDGRRVHFT